MQTTPWSDTPRPPAYIRAAAADAVATFIDRTRVYWPHCAVAIPYVEDGSVVEYDDDRYPVEVLLDGLHEPYVAGLVDRILGRRPMLFHADACPGVTEPYMAGFTDCHHVAYDVERAARLTGLDLEAFSGRSLSGRF